MEEQGGGEGSCSWFACLLACVLWAPEIQEAGGAALQVFYFMGGAISVLPCLIQFQL